LIVSSKAKTKQIDRVEEDRRYLSTRSVQNLVDMMRERKGKSKRVEDAVPKRLEG
jgi:hypothetical protein